MGNDMTWEQKCRISALRAACASQFTIFGVPTHLTMPPDAEADEHMTARILARAEAFRIALMSDGALDYTPDDDEASKVIEGTVENCTRCLRAITWFQPPDFEGRWIDPEGISQCHNNDRSYGDHTIEREMPESNVCPGCGASYRMMPLQVNNNDGIPEICRHKWHQE